MTMNYGCEYKTYYKFRDCEYDWRALFLLHENISIETVCSWLCNKTLTEIYRLLFFMLHEIYKKDFKFNHMVQKTIELIASHRRFDFFDRNPVEISNGRICIWELEQFD